MKKGTKISYAKGRKGAFQKWYDGAEDAPVVHKFNSDEVFLRDPDEEFWQCKDPFPVYWYVSKKGNVLNFKNPQNPYLQPCSTTDDPDRYSYKYNVHKNGKPQKDKYKSCRTYVVPFETLRAYGFYQEKVYGKETEIYEYHHEYQLLRDGTEESKIKNNNPDYITKVAKSAHPILTFAQQHPMGSRTEEQTEKLRYDLSEIAEKHYPRNITVFYEGTDKRVTLEVKDTLKTCLDNAPFEVIVLIALQIKAFHINTFLYKECPDIDNLIYPSIYRNSETNEPIWMVFISYSRSKYYKQMLKKYFAPDIVNPGHDISQLIFRDEIEMISQVEMIMPEKGYRIYPEIPITVKQGGNETL